MKSQTIRKTSKEKGKEEKSKDVDPPARGLSCVVLNQLLIYMVFVWDYKTVKVLVLIGYCWCGIDPRPLLLIHKLGRIMKGESPGWISLIAAAVLHTVRAEQLPWSLSLSQRVSVRKPAETLQEKGRRKQINVDELISVVATELYPQKYFCIIVWADDRACLLSRWGTWYSAKRFNRQARTLLYAGMLRTVYICRWVMQIIWRKRWDLSIFCNNWIDEQY